MSIYTTMPKAKLMGQLENDLRAAGARLLAFAMAMPTASPNSYVEEQYTAERNHLIRASDALLIAARKVGKHLGDWEEDDAMLG